VALVALVALAALMVALVLVLLTLTTVLTIVLAVLTIVVVVLVVLVVLLGPVAPLLLLILIVIIVVAGRWGVARGGGGAVDRDAATDGDSIRGGGGALQAEGGALCGVDSVGLEAGQAHASGTGRQSWVAALAGKVGAGVGRAPGLAIVSASGGGVVEGSCLSASAGSTAHREGSQCVGAGHPDGGIKGLVVPQLPPDAGRDGKRGIGGSSHGTTRGTTAGPQVEDRNGGSKASGATTR